MSSVRQSLRFLPVAAKTGLGSLPYTNIDAALRVSFRHELPFLPQLPALDAAELLLPAALEGLPGFGRDAEIDVELWRRKRDGFAAELERALSSRELAAFEPTVHAGFQPFLRRVEADNVRFAKVQLAGPATVRWFAKTSGGEPASELAELDQQIFRLLLARSLALVHAVRRTNATPILFLDEPGLIALDLRNARHQLVLEELRLLTHAAQSAGALVGIHCCGNTDWGALLGLGLDILSIDARLSLDAVLDEKTAWPGFLATGATLALGIIPTEPGASYVLSELVDSVEASLRATTPKFQAVLGRMILTPACGLGARSVPDAERIIGEVALAQQQLQTLAASSAPG